MEKFDRMVQLLDEGCWSVIFGYAYKIISVVIVASSPSDH